MLQYVWGPWATNIIRILFMQDSSYLHPSRLSFIFINDYIDNYASKITWVLIHWIWNIQGLWDDLRQIYARNLFLPVVFEKHFQGACTFRHKKINFRGSVGSVLLVTLHWVNGYYSIHMASIRVINLYLYEEWRPNTASVVGAQQ